jgi:thiol-disulfide isomerase/thioredoxin
MDVLFNILASAGIFVVLYLAFRFFASSPFAGTPVTAAQQETIKGKTIHVGPDVQAFKTLIASPKLTVCDFTATWCGPCQYIAPVFGRLSVQHENVQFLKIDVDECKVMTKETSLLFLKKNKKKKGDSRFVLNFCYAHVPVLQIWQEGGRILRG